jgi:hypothetical protein
MKADPEIVREHYNSLSDEELLAENRADLVEIAQQYHDAEVSRRGLNAARKVRTADIPAAAPAQLDIPEEEEAGTEVLSPGQKPEWLADAAEAYSVYVSHGSFEDPRVADASRALEAAGIPCYMELIELTPNEKEPPSATHRWRLMVPGNLTFRATSIVDRDVLNADFEVGWKAHLEMLSNNELVAMHPKTVFCNLFDRIERATRVYEEEMARRGLKLKSH